MTSTAANLYADCLRVVNRHDRTSFGTRFSNVAPLDVSRIPDHWRRARQLGSLMNVPKCPKVVASFRQSLSLSTEPYVSCASYVPQLVCNTPMLNQFSNRLLGSCAKDRPGRMVWRSLGREWQHRGARAERSPDNSTRTKRRCRAAPDETSWSSCWRHRDWPCNRKTRILFCFSSSILRRKCRGVLKSAQSPS